MGVMLERVQNKFACIIGELCGEPDVLSEFAIWLDLRLAEYKSKGMISLECSGESPNPNWLRGHKDKRVRTSKPREGRHQFDCGESGYDQDMPDEVAERLSPAVSVVKEELTDDPDIVPVGVYRHRSSTPQQDVKSNHGRKRPFTNTSAMGTSDSSLSEYKMQRLSPSPSESEVEPANQSLMSIIKESEPLDDSGDVSGNVSREYSDVNTPDNGNTCSSTVVPSTSSVDSTDRLDADDTDGLSLSSGFAQHSDFPEPESLRVSRLYKGRRMCYKTYSPESMFRAVNGVVAKGMKIAEASRLYKVPESSIRNQIRKGCRR